MAANRTSPKRLLVEHEDAQITGLTRSLTRRLLALNIGGSLRRTPVAEPSVAV